LPVQNHGVDESIVAKTFEQSKAFFALPDEVKREVSKERKHKRPLLLILIASITGGYLEL
jgi:isopenicillin N synthase-like dioxygenase